MLHDYLGLGSGGLLGPYTLGDGLGFDQQYRQLMNQQPTAHEQQRLMQATLQRDDTALVRGVPKEPKPTPQPATPDRSDRRPIREKAWMCGYILLSVATAYLWKRSGTASWAEFGFYAAVAALGIAAVCWPDE